jgi:acyl-CoA reductase-like NAD-dependent aldehyde dehydrogenase
MLRWEFPIFGAPALRLILVQDGVYDASTKRLAETAGAMKVAGFEPGAVIGPLIDMKAVEKGRGTSPTQ